MIREIISRMIQIFIGSFIFDCPILLLKLRTIGYKLVVKSIGGGVNFGRKVFFYTPHNVRKADICIGNNVGISPNVEIDCSAALTIGDYVWISQNVQIFSHTHPIKGNIVKERQRVEISKPKYIGRDAWIGANSIILPNVTYIGDNAIIGAGSVVTKNIENNMIVAGNPAVTIGKRE